MPRSTLHNELLEFQLGQSMLGCHPCTLRLVEQTRHEVVEWLENPSHVPQHEILQARATDLITLYLSSSPLYECQPQSQSQSSQSRSQSQPKSRSQPQPQLKSETQFQPQPQEGGSNITSSSGSSSSSSSILRIGRLRSLSRRIRERMRGVSLFKRRCAVHECLVYALITADLALPSLEQLGAEKVRVLGLVLRLAYWGLAGKRRPGSKHPGAGQLLQQTPPDQAAPPPRSGGGYGADGSSDSGVSTRSSDTVDARPARQAYPECSPTFRLALVALNDMIFRVELLYDDAAARSSSSKRRLCVLEFLSILHRIFVFFPPPFSSSPPPPSSESQGDKITKSLSLDFLFIYRRCAEALFYELPPPPQLRLYLYLVPGNHVGRPAGRRAWEVHDCKCLLAMQRRRDARHSAGQKMGRDEEALREFLDYHACDTSPQETKNREERKRSRDRSRSRSRSRNRGSGGSGRRRSWSPPGPSPLRNVVSAADLPDRPPSSEGSSRGNRHVETLAGGNRRTTRGFLPWEFLF